MYLLLTKRVRFLIQWYQKKYKYINNRFWGIIWGRGIQVPSAHVAANFWGVLCLKLLVSGQTFILFRDFYITLFAICLHFFLLLSLSVILSAWHWSEIHVFHVGVEAGLEAHSCISELHRNDKDWVICKVPLDWGVFQDAWCIFFLGIVNIPFNFPRCIAICGYPEV